MTIKKQAAARFTGTLSSAILSLVSATLLLNPVVSLASEEIFVPAGDAAGFISAIVSANMISETTVIRLEAGAPYELNLGERAPDAISAHVVLQGDGAVLVGQGADNYGRLFEIAEGAHLDIADLAIRDFSSEEVSEKGLIFNAGTLSIRDVQIEGITSGTNSSRPLIINEGRLDLDRVRISEVTLLATDSTQRAVIVLDNHGNARLRNVLISDSRALVPGSTRSFGTLISANYFAAGEGLASLGVSFSTLVGDSSDLTGPTDLEPFFRQCYPPALCASLGITATMILGLPCPLGESAHSNGFNLITDDQCDGHRPSDLVGVSPGHVKFDRDESGAPRLSLSPFSPAVDRVGAQADCPARDASRFQRNTDGNFDGIARCDIGAFENPRGRTVLNGGENGLWYSAGSDGHYVTIEEVRPREYVIFWNTFDRNGNQAWVLGVGSRQGDEIVTDAYFQPEGVLIPGMGAEVNTDALRDWGTIRIIPHDCASGTFVYDSLLGRFGAGTFALDRLGMTEGIGCKD